MLQAPLPAMPEYDPLDEHLDDLEDPGTNLLLDFITPARTTTAPDATPQSISNGYTSASEESECSAATPSDEQMYSDMSFLQTADTRELIEVVANYVEDDNLTELSPQQQRVFAAKSAPQATGKMIKGKTSKYRGVTQTSKTSWGAKYSAKRITNTCKTPHEAARVYDQYLKTHYPEKYAKFANFCGRCDQFVNPLGLPEFRNECCCDATSDGGSTEVESPPQHSEIDADEETELARQQQLLARGISSDGVEFREGSNLSIDSLKLSFLEDSEPLFDDIVLQPNHHEETTSAVTTGDKKPMKRDSLTMAAVESFTNDGNLDQIIKDIDRSSLPKKPSFSHSNSLGASGGGGGGFAPNSSASTTAVTDFSPEEWQNLSEYLLVDQGLSGGGVQHPHHPTTATNQAPMPAAQHDQQRFAYKKIHSLDFDPVDAATEHHHVDVKQEYPSAIDVDDLASAFMPPPPPSSSLHAQVATPTPSLPMQTTSSPSFPARVDIQTLFLEKYWRNDRKNMQCFPYCPEHGDYYRVRIENLQHRCKGVCRAPVRAHITIPTVQLLSPSGLLLLSRCNSTFSRNEALSTQQYLNATEIKNLQALSAVGVVDKFNVLPDGSGVHFEVTFYPDVWKFEFDLPKKRRHGGAGEPDLDAASSEFLYFFEIDVLYTADKVSYQRLGHAESMSFQMGNTRTLLRQRNRMTEEPSDSDRVLGLDAMPEKKKIKMRLGQHGQTSAVVNEEEDEDFDPALVSSKKVGTGASKHVDVDALGRPDSKDSAFDLEDGTYIGKTKKTLQGHDEDDAEDPAGYAQYRSPKGTKVLLADSNNATAVASAVMTDNKAATARDDAAKRSDSPDAHSWSKLFAYSIVSIPLSIVFLPVALVGLVLFLVAPPIAGGIVRCLDAMSDIELRQANSSFVQSDTRYVLNRLDSGKGKGMLRFHSDGAVWSRFVYFCGVKLVVAVVVFVPTLVLSLVGLFLFPIRPASRGVLRGATSAALASREFTRKSVGKTYTDSNPQGDALV